MVLRTGRLLRGLFLHCVRVIGWAREYVRHHPTALVVGAQGSIGRALTLALRSAGTTVTETHHRHTQRPEALMLDLARNVAAWPALPDVQVAYLCAAVSSLATCRTAPTATARVNVHGAAAVAEHLVKRGAFVVFLSTDLVYDGTRPGRRPEEPVCPRTEYGRQKADAEARLAALGASIAVVRLSKVLGPTMALLRGWADALRRREAIAPFSDVALAPIPLGFAVDALIRVGNRRLPGIVQVSGAADVTYAHVAHCLAQRLHVPRDLVRPICSSEAGIPLEATPSYATLDTSRLEEEFDLPPPSVWEAVDAVLHA